MLKFQNRLCLHQLSNGFNFVFRQFTAIVDIFDLTQPVSKHQPSALGANTLPTRPPGRLSR